MSQDRKIYTAEEIRNLIKVSKAVSRINANRGHQRIDAKELEDAIKAEAELEAEMMTAGLLTLQAFVQAHERIASALEKIADNNKITREKL